MGGNVQEAAWEKRTPPFGLKDLDRVSPGDDEPVPALPGPRGVRAPWIRDVPKISGMRARSFPLFRPNAR